MGPRSGRFAHLSQRKRRAADSEECAHHSRPKEAARDHYACPYSIAEGASDELAKIGLGSAEMVTDGRVIRVPKAYPVYDDTYKHGLEEVRRFLTSVARKA